MSFWSWKARGRRRTFGMLGTAVGAAMTEGAVGRVVGWRMATGDAVGWTMEVEATAAETGGWPPRR